MATAEKIEVTTLGEPEPRFIEIEPGFVDAELARVAAEARQAAAQPAQATPQQLPVATVDDLLNAPTNTIQTKTVEIPAWGRSVVIRQVSADEMIDLRQKATTPMPPGQPDIFDYKKFIKLLCVASFKQPVVTMDVIEHLFGGLSGPMEALATEITQFNKVAPGSEVQAEQKFPV